MTLIIFLYLVCLSVVTVTVVCFLLSEQYWPSREDFSLRRALHKTKEIAIPTNVQIATQKYKNMKNSKAA
jgi:hypothetical protein